MTWKSVLLILGVGALIGGLIGRSWFAPKPDVSDEPLAKAEAEIVVRIDTVIVEKIVQIGDSTFKWEYEDDELFIKGTCYGVQINRIRVDFIEFTGQIELGVYSDHIEATPRDDRLTMHFDKLTVRKAKRERSLVRPVISGGMMLGVSGYSLGLGLELEYIPFMGVPLGWIVTMEYTKIEKSDNFGIRVIVPLTK